MPLPTPDSPDPSKLQRWTDLLAALLARNFLVTFEELAQYVPAYARALAETSKESVKRTFERDKDELRAFGIPIERQVLDAGQNAGYRLRPRRFYLPYVVLAASAHRPAQPQGYRTLPVTEFTAQELQLLADALQRLEALGDPTLAGDARHTLAKLVFDLPAAPDVSADVAILGVDDRIPKSTFATLTLAVRRHKRVRFEYRSPATGTRAERVVHPYGLVFIHAHWYLVARDPEQDAMRNFRVSRMTRVSVNRDAIHTPDFEVPSEFRLHQHARSRAAWDLGDVEPVAAEVRFTGGSGAARAAAAVGHPVSGDDEVRRFEVRRLDAFARWVLSFGGEAVPLSPPALVDTWRSLAAGALDRYLAASAWQGDAR